MLTVHTAEMPRGHFLYPSLEQGLQLNDAISKFLIGIAS